MHHRLPICALLVFAVTCSAGDNLLLDEQFDLGMDGWWVEGGERVWVEGGRLHVDADPAKDGPRAATVWARQPISGDVKVTFDAHIVSSSVNVNNINLFLFYSDPAGKPLEATAPQRIDGEYNRYHALNGYIFTFVNEPRKDAAEGGPARARMRRCPGFHLLTETRQHHCRAGHTYQFEIIRRGGKLSFSVDGRQLLTADDPHPHREGLLGLRTFRTYLWWDNIRVEQLPATEPK